MDTTYNALTDDNRMAPLHQKRWWRLLYWHRLNWIWDLISHGWSLRDEHALAASTPVPGLENWRQLERALVAQAPARAEFAAPGYGTC